MSRKALFILSACFLVFFFSCSTTRKAGGKKNRTTVVDTANAAAVNSKLKDNSFTFEWLSGKAKITLLDKEGTRDATANFRIRRDSVIWLSISSLGFEGLRVLITQDSIRVIDRLNKRYYAKDYSFFKDFTQIAVDYQTLQSIITGVPLYFDEKKLKARKEDSTYVLLSDGKKKSSTIHLNPDYTMVNMDLVDSTVGKSLKLKYKNYDKANLKPFALDREVELNDAHVFINFTKVVVNQPLKFPFNVKEKYE